jgi:hypothetical protein
MFASQKKRHIRNREYVSEHEAVEPLVVLLAGDLPPICPVRRPLDEP